MMFFKINMVKIFWCIVFSSILYFRDSYSYSILAVFAPILRSHSMMYSSLTIEMARRGHNVEVYTSHPINEKHVNYREIDASHCFPNHGNFDFNNFQSISMWNVWQRLLIWQAKIHKAFTNCSVILDLITSTKKFDAVITEPFYTDFFANLASKFNATLINIFSSELPFYLLDRMGSPSNPSYIKESLTETPGGFFQRLRNFAFYLYTAASVKYIRIPNDDKICENLFGYDGLNLLDVLKNTSLILINTHPSFNQPLPLVPRIVEVGGIHIGNASKLPQNIEKFINESQHGVVYFCMGSLLRGETFPVEKREAFLYAFSKIPQRVLWKWEGDVLPGKSDNIMISKWMPQRDILAHPNVKLFISHGGLLGTSEAVYEGVPVLGIPIFGDQRTNIKSLEANGAGELLDYNEISKEVVLDKIQRLLNDPKYKENAKQLSERYRDRPMSPLDTAVYWTEYVIRHKGAPHLRTAAADMPWYQYLLLDVIAFLIAVLVTALVIIYYSIKITLRFLCNLICGKKSSSKPEKKVKRN